MKRYRGLFVIFSLCSLFLICTYSGVIAENEKNDECALLRDPKSVSEIRYHLVWQDLFDADTLDTEHHWNVEENGDGGGNSELQYYSGKNVSLGVEPESGTKCLILTARKEVYRHHFATSGRLNSKDKVSFKYGKIEARIKLPKTSDGLWPAFWLLGVDISSVSWPACGEIDILEMGHADGIKSQKQDRYFNGACHWSVQPGNNHMYHAEASFSPYNIQDDFHLYTLIWDSESLKMYLDQDKYPEVDPYFQMSLTDEEKFKDAAKYFRKPYFIIFNLAVGGNFPQVWDINNITALSGGEAKMYVDYVKVYQRGETGEEYSGPVSVRSGQKENLAQSGR